MKSFNRVDMKGRLYNYKLQTVDTDKGEAISGSIDLEVDADGTKAEIRYFAYPVYNSGKKNATYGVLDSIMAGNYKTVVDDGDEADWLACSASIDVNYFVSQRSDDGELARSQKIRGAFINANKDKKYTNSWELDFLITSIIDVDADEEKGYPRYLKVSGYMVDDYNKRLMAVNFQARKEAAVEYIAGLEASAQAPYFVRTGGKLSKTVSRVVKRNAFGEDSYNEYENVHWTIESMEPDAYEFGSDAVMTQEQYDELLGALEEYLEDVKSKSANDSGSTGKKKLSF